MSGSFTPLGRMARKAVRLTLPGWSWSGPEELPAPAVFLVHHQNLAGPIRAMALLPREPRLWVLAPFCDRRSCFEQYYDHTFTRRFGWPKAPAWAVSRLLSLLIPNLLAQFRVIPVWRGSMKLRDTLRMSTDALIQGQSILLCPDRDYASTSPEIGPLYDGFLALDRPYFRATGCHLPFIPLYCSASQKRLTAGTPLFFSGALPVQAEKAQLAQQLARAMNELGRQCGDVENGRA